VAKSSCGSSPVWLQVTTSRNWGGKTKKKKPQQMGQATLKEGEGPIVGADSSP